MNRIFITFCLYFVFSVVTLAQGYTDVTQRYIKNPDLQSQEGWTYSRVNVSGETLTWSAVSKSYSGSYVSEIFAGSELKYKTYEVWQKITLPRGAYHLYGRAFQRDADKVIMFVRQVNARDSVAVASVADQFDSSPNNLDEAAKAFNANMYLNDLAFTVADDETEVTIGYEGGFTGGGQWFAFGGFTLYQVQDEISPVHPKDVTPSLTRAMANYTGLTGCYKKADSYIHEKYSTANFGVGMLVSQTFKGLENGFYQVVIQANASQANGVGSLSASPMLVVAGQKREVMEPVTRSAVDKVDEYVLSDVEVTNGTLRVGIQNQSVGCNWLLFNVKSLKYLGAGNQISHVTLKRDETFSIGSIVQADVDSDIPLRAGQLNSIALPFSMTAAQTAAAFSRVYTLAGVERDAEGNLQGILIDADSIDFGRGYFVEVSEDKMLSATNVYLQPGAPAEEYSIWGESLVSGHFGKTALKDVYVLSDNGELTFVSEQTDVPGFMATVSLPAALGNNKQPITLTHIDYSDVHFTVDIENIQVRHFINDNTYTEDSPSVVDSYNVSPPERRDQPSAICIPLPSQEDSVTLKIEGIDCVWRFPASDMLRVYNLYPQREYRYTVEAAEKVISSGRFNITGHLRMIMAETGNNIRDLGGWETAEGLRLRHGLLYRSGELNGGHTMSEADKQEMLRLGIGAELDLREDVDIADFAVDEVPLSKSSSFGQDFPYLYQNQHRFGDDALRIDTACWRTSFKFVIDNLRAGKSVLFHCIWGADRTGCMAFLIEGLLGLPIDQLYKDYELTTFSIADSRLKSGLDSKLAYINTLPGNTLQQRFFYYLHNVAGVPGNDLLELIDRMVEGESSITKSQLALMSAADTLIIQDVHSLSAVCPRGATIADGAHAILTDASGSQNEIEMSVDGIAIRFGHYRLAPASTYSLTIPAGAVSDADGNANAEALKIAFKTPLMSDGEYYFYMPTLERFLGRGANFGTRAVADRFGVPVTLTTDISGISTFRYLDNLLYLGSDGFTDKDFSYNSVYWTLKQTDAEHPERLVMLSNNGFYLNLVDNTRARVEATSPAEATQVELVGIERQKEIVQQQQDENILQAAQDAGIEAADMSVLDAILSDEYSEIKNVATIKGSKLGNATFWPLTEPTDVQNASGNAYNVGAYGGELFMKHGQVSQTVTVKYPGLYKLTLTAFYRQGRNSRCYEIGNKGYKLSNAYVTINDVYYAQIPDWYSDCVNSSNPNTTDQASSLMLARKYTTNVYAYVGEDLQATISINCPSFITNGWCIFNNFYLAYFRNKENAIGTLEADETHEEVFDLVGRRVHNNQQPAAGLKKGIYIIKGQKLVR
ncbi:MAG: tyrosine-protein phosphatase [Bacteroidaceae bacterium]|nr:tyrosine-protein phosphatase [Bacteroidaceae bacterium]